MDSQAFDTLTATFAQTHTRRRTFGVMGAVIAGLVGVAAQGADAKKRKKKKQRAATCRDGIKNGIETDVDCGGGTCPPCATGRGRQVSQDFPRGTNTRGAGGTPPPTQPCWPG